MFRSKLTPNLKSRKLRLQTTLVVPFVLQIVTVVGLVSYLSFRNGQKAVHDLATQLRSESSARIDQYLQRYIENPQIVNQLNATALAQGTLDLVEITGGAMLLQQIKLSPFVNAVYCGDRNGNFFGMTREVDRIAIAQGTYRAMVSNASTQGRMYIYNIDEWGNPTNLSEVMKPYDPRQRPWYKVGVVSRKPAWSEIYIDFSSELLTVTASVPAYSWTDKTLLGVCGADILLSEEMRKFLKSLDISKSGRAFIIDRSGKLISTSTNEPLMIDSGERLKAINSSNVLIQATAKSLSDRFNDLSQIQHSLQTDFKLNGQRQFVQVLPFGKETGLNWLIVIVVPESDFMGQIDTNTRNTTILSLGALIVAIAVGVYTSRWLIRPITKLTQASNEMASGNLDQYIQTSGLLKIDELEKLANSFNSMAGQLKASFDTLETQKNAFARFFPSEFLKFLHKQDVTEVELGDYVSKEMAIVFSDIRSFTTLSECLTPQENFDFVNAYLQRVGPEIRNHNGFVVKFIGDAVMSVFPDGVDDALQAGIAQFKQLQQFNLERQAQESFSIRIGMGIHFGNMMVGMVGEYNRMQGDAISDNVNLTARLEGLTKFYGASLILSEQVMKQLKHPEQYQIRFLDRAIVKGRTESIGVYEVMDVEEELVRNLKLKTLPEFQLGLEHYSQGKLEAAKVNFEQVVAINPMDKTAKLYLERIRQLEAEGVPINWTGVWAFTQK